MMLMFKLTHNELMGFFPAAFVMKRQKMSSKEAINFVRKLRPYSIETWSQEECLKDYEKFLLTQNSPKKKGQRIAIVRCCEFM